MNHLLCPLVVAATLCTLLSGCKNDPTNSSSATVAQAGEIATSTRVTAIDAPTKNRPAPVAAGKQQTRTTNSESTEPVAVIYGQILTHSGTPATSTVVTLEGYQKTDGTDRYAFRDIAETVTDSRGRYEVQGPISHSLSLKLSGNAPSLKIPLPDEKFYQDSKPRRGLTRFKNDILLPETVTVRGTVVDASGTPLPGLPVQIFPIVPQYQTDKNRDTRVEQPTRTTTTAEGKFEIPFAAAGPWQIATVHPDYAPLLETIELPTTDSLTLKLTARGGTIRGRMVHKSTGEPAADVPVTLFKQNSNALTGLNLYNARSTVDGAFRFDHVSAGAANLDVPLTPESTLGMAAPAPGQLNLEEGETTDVTVLVYPGHTLIGRVYDKDTDEGLPAQVWAQNGTDGGLKATADSSGNFRIDHIFSQGTDERNVSIRLDGYSILSNEQSLPYRGSTTVGVTFPADTLEVKQNFPMVRKLVITGKVVTSSEKPVPTATVWLNDTYLYSHSKVPVNQDGTFKLETLPFHKTQVVAEAKGYAVAASTEIELTTVDVDNITIKLEPGAFAQGRVLDPEGKPVAGATISTRGDIPVLNNSKPKSGSDGSFIASDLPANFTITATKEGYAASEAQKLSLAPGETRAGLELVLRKSNTIAGRVLRADRTPEDGVYIYARSLKNAAATNADKDGRFEIKDLPEGTFELHVYGQSTKSVPGIKTGTTDLEIVLDQTPAAPQGTNKLIGTVVDDVSGKPVEDFTATFGGHEVRKLEKPGTFEISSMLDGAGYQISITSPGYLKQEFPVVAAEGGKSREQTFRMSKGGAITGRLIDKATKKPIPSVVVLNWGAIQIFDRQDKTPENHTISDSEGRFVMAPAPIGQNYVLAKPAAPYSEIGKTVTVSSEQTADMGDIELSSGGTITGTVVRGSKDEPVPSVRVTLTGDSIDLTLQRSATTDAEGKFKFEGLPPLRYMIRAEGIGKSTVIDGEKTVDVLLRIGGVTMSGRILRGNSPTQASLSASGPEGASFSTYASSGEYTIENMIAGKYQVSIRAQNGHDIKEPETVEVPDQPEFTHDFILPDGTIEVTVVNTEGTPVADASVALTRKSSNAGVDQRWVTRTEGQQRTDAEGRARFSGLAAGEYGITARKIDAGTAMQPNVQVRDSGSTPVNLTLSNEGGTLVSVALNYTSGQPMPEPWCYLHSQSGPYTHKARRGADGVMTITNVPPGVYTTNVSYWGYSQSERQVEIKTNETARIEDVLYPAGAVHWTLKTASGVPAGGAQVTISPLSTDPPEEPRTGVTAADGKFVQRGLAPGTYQLTATFQGKPGPTETISFKAGENAMKETVAAGW